MVHGEQRIGARFWVAKLESKRRIDVGGGHFFHSRQRLDAALRLTCLGRLGAEAFNVAVQMRNFTLLLFIHALLQGQPFGTGAFEGAVVACVELEFLLFQIQHVIDDGVEKIAIMRD